MEAGKLRHKVTIQQPIEEENPDTGEFETKWDLPECIFATVWAEILPAVGKEYWASKQIVSEVTGKIRIRYIAGITPKMRIVYGSKIYGIEAVINVEGKNIELILMVSEKQ